MKNYKPDAKMLRRVLEALEISSYAKRRGELRKLAGEVLGQCFDEADFKNLCKDSPLIGEGDKQLNLKPNARSLLGSVDPEAMANVAALGSDAAQLMSAAILAPRGSCVRSDKSKTGYKFGLERRMNTLDELKVLVRNKLEEKGEDVTNMMGELQVADLSLDQLLSALAALHRSTGEALLELADTVGDMVTGERDKSRMEAVKSYLSQLNQSDLQEIKAMATEEGSKLAETVVEMLAGTTPDTVVVDEPEPSGGWVKARPSEAEEKLINMTLEAAKLPPIGELLDEVDALSLALKEAEKELEAKAKVVPMPVAAPSVVKTGMPEGGLRYAKAKDVFGLKAGSSLFNFDIPVWEWDAPHPDVPEVNENHLFDPYELMCVLIALVKNKPTYLHGHTGTGKTSLIEQVAARMNWPVFRINFDSEVTRADLLGKDSLIKEDGVTVSRFSEGVLPRYMQQGYVMIFDEFDFIRADVSYVMQRVLEKDRLVLTEDEGRVVTPHYMMRMFATGNTVGQGDEYGLYQGARVQSMALLNRFTNWKQIDYLDAGERTKLIRSTVPDLDDKTVELLAQYVTEHMAAFLEHQTISQPISPRDYLALADQAHTYLSYYPKGSRKDALNEAFKTTILDRANSNDRAVLAGIVDRVVG